MRMVVVLPAPFGPRKPEDLARAHLEGEVADGHELAEVFGQTVRPNGGGGRAHGRLEYPRRSMTDLQPRPELWRKPATRVAAAGGANFRVADSVLAALKAASVELVQRPLREADGSVASEVAEADILISGRRGGRRSRVEPVAQRALPAAPVRRLRRHRRRRGHAPRHRVRQRSRRIHRRSRQPHPGPDPGRQSQAAGDRQVRQERQMVGWRAATARRRFRSAACPR